MMGYDIDRSGGNIVTVQDILYHPDFEIVQIYGVDPDEFADRIQDRFLGKNS